MRKVAIFTHADDERINEWIEKNNVHVISISCSRSDNGYLVVILYETKPLVL